MGRSGIVLCAMLLLAVMGFAAPVLAGDLNPPGAPAPTMKTLDQVPPTWDQILPPDVRFKPALGNSAVLDRETGLVWEKSPWTTPATWEQAQYDCMAKAMAYRSGWRLPTIQELASLTDASPDPPAVALPAGHPFENVQPNHYWATTTHPVVPSYAMTIHFGMHGIVQSDDKANSNYEWCVRGGRGSDGQ